MNVLTIGLSKQHDQIVCTQTTHLRRLAGRNRNVHILVRNTNGFIKSIFREASDRPLK